jgi:uncharacterized protein YbbC (DUF1343 family)
MTDGRRFLAATGSSSHSFISTSYRPLLSKYTPSVVSGAWSILQQPYSQPWELDGTETIEHSIIDVYPVKFFSAVEVDVRVVVVDEVLHDDAVIGSDRVKSSSHASIIDQIGGVPPVLAQR